MLRKFFIVLAILLAVGLVLCWIYLPSFSRYYEIRQEKDKYQKRIQEIDSQIRALTDEKYLLQNDVTYLEKVIREELGFVKPGEIIYEMVTKKDTGNTEAPAAAVTTSNAGSKSSTSSIVPAQPRIVIQDADGAKKSLAKTSAVRSPSTKTAPPKRRPR